MKKNQSKSKRTANAPLKSLLAELLVKNTSDTVFAFYYNTKTGVANRGCCGYSSVEIAKGGLNFLVHITAPSSRKRLQMALEYLQASGDRISSLHLEITPKHASNLRRRVQATFAPLCDSRHRVIGVHGVYRDITEFYATEQALKESEARFIEVVESAHDLVWILDNDGCWSYVNGAAKAIYGYEPDQLIGKPFKGITHPDHWENDAFVMQQVLTGKEYLHHETVHIRADGGERVMSFNAKPRMDKYWNIIGAMGTARDVTEQKEYQRQLEHFAKHDALTGTYNRHHFQGELERAVERIGRGPLHSGLLYIDLDNFKYINDIVGHAAGDKLLVEVSALLQERLRHGDLLARFGGDEFTVLLQGVDLERLQIAAASYCRLVSAQIFTFGDKNFNLSASIGATLLMDEAYTSGDFLGQADLACTLAKSRGRNQFHIYDATDESKAVMVADVGWAQKIRQALEREEFTMVYQPIVQVRGGQITHYEALLRLRGVDNGGDLIAPGAFLPAAVRFGLMQVIDRWVVAHVIAQMGSMAGSRACPHFAVNLSGRAFEDITLLPLIADALALHQVPPACLTFEITEREAISHFLSAKVFIGELKKIGCQLALDDFGSGFSSYSYLKALPVDYLKIDGSFVQRLASDSIDQALVKSMNEVAHALGKLTIAEFVEDEHTMEILRQFGVDYAQGYHLGKPAATFEMS